LPGIPGKCSSKSLEDSSFIGPPAVYLEGKGYGGDGRDRRGTPSFRAGEREMPQPATK
jgi:hypothetical protein